MTTVINTHIQLDDAGVAWIEGTRIKVIEVVLDKLAHGSSPEEIHFQYPHLSLSQIHAALAYYYDHQSEVDAEIRRRWLEADELAAGASDSALRQKLLALKNAPSRREIAARSYRRVKGHDTWHWCRNCSFWPSSDYEEKDASGYFNGGLCNECLAKEKGGGCCP